MNGKASALLTSVSIFLDSFSSQVVAWTSRKDFYLASGQVGRGKVSLSYVAWVRG